MNRKKELTERIVKESVNRILMEVRKPNDRIIGRHKFRGEYYDKNGNPIYTHPSKLDDPEGGTLSDDFLKNYGWRYSKSRGLHGQILDPTSILSESSYDSMGNFDAESHNADLREQLADEVRNFNESLNDTMDTLDRIAQSATGDEIKRRVRVILNALLQAGRDMRDVTQLIMANR